MEYKQHMYMKHGEEVRRSHTITSKEVRNYHGEEVRTLSINSGINGSI